MRILFDGCRCFDETNLRCPLHRWAPPLSDKVPPMAQARAFAKDSHVREIMYLDKWGYSGARDDRIARVLIRFSNGEEVYLSPKEFVMLRDVDFKLQPVNYL